MDKTFFAALSIFLAATDRAAFALSASLLLTRASTCLMAVRIADLIVALCARRSLFVFVRLIADLMFGNVFHLLRNNLCSFFYRLDLNNRTNCILSNTPLDCNINVKYFYLKEVLWGMFAGQQGNTINSYVFGGNANMEKKA